MKTIITCGIICLVLAVSVAAEELYDADNIISVEITFEQDNWDEILDQYYAAGQEERLAATAIINGIRFDSVGVRYKGNSSYSAQQKKNPFSIKLDYIIDDQKYDGYGTLKFSNGFMDPSWIRETLGYEIARKYAPASLSNYAAVTINGEFMGLYVNTQTVDKFFLRSHFNSDENTFVEGDPPSANIGGIGIIVPGDSGRVPPGDSSGTFNPDSTQQQFPDSLGNIPPDSTRIPGDTSGIIIPDSTGNPPRDSSGIFVPDSSRFPPDSSGNFPGWNNPGGGAGGAFSSTLQYLGADSSGYMNAYQLKSDNGWQDLIELCEALNDNSSDLEAILDIDRALWFLAYHNLLVSLDSPINASHNYYLYQDDSGRFNIIFWDLNMVFGTFGMNIGGGGGQQADGGQNITSLQQLNPFLNFDNSEYPLLYRIFQNSEYRKMYIAHFKTIMKENFSNGWYLTRAEELQEIIDTQVLNDPNKFYTYQDFQDNVRNSTASGNSGARSSGIVGIAELMEARVRYLNQLPDIKASAPVIANISNLADNGAGSRYWITARVSNAAEVRLSYRTSSFASFTRVEMKDDGFSQDGLAGDGVYGAPLESSAQDIQYLLYAANDDAATFSPARAEYEYYVLPVTGDLVINEFMADNESTVADQDGEFEDWIELYNNSSEDISLHGYYLSDDHTELALWAIPDTVIPAGGYLIVFADDDDQQAGLHANFKLSASGEEILLVDPNLTVVDHVVFGQQQTDKSTGRSPNGRGAFTEMSHTCAETNPDLNDEGQYTTGDVNRDGTINVMDLLELLSLISSSASSRDNPSADCNHDGLVNIFDLLELMQLIKTSAPGSTLASTGSFKGIEYNFGTNYRFTFSDQSTLTLNPSDVTLADVQATTGLAAVVAGLEDTASRRPYSFTLSQNYPNPFNPSTLINFTVPENQQVHVELMIFDIRGKLLRTLVDGVYTGGDYRTEWDGRDNLGRTVGSGVLIYRLKAGDYVATRKMVMLK